MLAIPARRKGASPGSDELAIPGYDHLDHKQIGAQDLMSTVRQPLMRERLTSTFERVEAARDEREQLREEARYRRERLALYRARLYGGRAASQGKLRELQRASDGASARLRRAEAAAPSTRRPTGAPRSPVKER
jgi:hypothetical protein